MQTPRPESLLCPCCKYDLRGLSAIGRCPECGRRYRLIDLIAQQRGERKVRIFCHAAVPAIVVVWFVVRKLDFGRYGYEVWPVGIAALVVLACYVLTQLLPYRTWVGLAYTTVLTAATAFSLSVITEEPNDDFFYPTSDGMMHAVGMFAAMSVTLIIVAGVGIGLHLFTRPKS